MLKGLEALALGPTALASNVQPLTLALRVEALASGPTALASNVQPLTLALRVEALALRFWPRLHH